MAEESEDRIVALISTQPGWVVDSETAKGHTWHDPVACWGLLKDGTVVALVAGDGYTLQMPNDTPGIYRATAFRPYLLRTSDE